MPKLRHKAPKQNRKVRVSGSVDKDAYDILVRIAESEKRNRSNALNMVLYEAGAKRGLRPSTNEEKP